MVRKGQEGAPSGHNPLDVVRDEDWSSWVGWMGGMMGVVEEGTGQG